MRKKNLILLVVLLHVQVLAPVIATVHAQGIAQEVPKITQDAVVITVAPLVKVSVLQVVWAVARVVAMDNARVLVLQAVLVVAKMVVKIGAVIHVPGLVRKR